MWMTGLAGMVTKYSEAVLAVKYREKGQYGMRGGPMYYLANGAGLPWLGWLFALLMLIARKILRCIISSTAFLRLN
jgi:AGCS family alanine or glycine:cation symporter